MVHPCLNALALTYITGFRPGSRFTFVSAKGPKTIDAQSGHIQKTDARGERTNSLASNRARKISKSVRPSGLTVGVEIFVEGAMYYNDA